MNKHREFRIDCYKGYLRLVKDTKLFDKMWIPINMPNFKSNMDKNEAETFLYNNPDLKIKF